MELTKQFEEIIKNAANDLYPNSKIIGHINIMNAGTISNNIAIKALEAAYNLGRESKSISCKERNPDEDGRYLVLDDDGDWSIGLYDKGSNSFMDDDGGIIKWQPLPPSIA